MEKIYRTIENKVKSDYNFNEIYSAKSDDDLIDFSDWNEGVGNWLDYRSKVLSKVISILHEVTEAYLRTEGARLFQREHENPNNYTRNLDIFVMENGAIVVPYSECFNFFLKASDNLSPRIQKNLLDSIQKAEEEIRSLKSGEIK